MKLLLLLCLAVASSFKFGHKLRKIASIAIGAGLSGSLLSPIAPAFAEDVRIVADIPTSGLVFKDTLQIKSFRDPKMPNVHLYLADFERPITEKVSGDFFNDPSSSSLSCVRTGPVTGDQRNSLDTNREGEEIFKENKNLLFKSIKVNRVYDKESKTAIYTSFSSKTDKGNDKNKSRFKASLCAVALD